MYKTRKTIERACIENYECIGYSTISIEYPAVKKLSYVEDLEAENGFYPWCMKSSEGHNQADEQHNYYRRTRRVQYIAANCLIH